MYKVHFYVGSTLNRLGQMEHIPSPGDIVRIDFGKYAKVVERTWCFDEYSEEGQRVNIAAELITKKTRKQKGKKNND